MPIVTLRTPTESDLPLFFHHHQDPDALWMAAFTPPNPHDEAVMLGHWRGLMQNAAVDFLSIETEGAVAGSIVCFGPPDDRNVGYWLGREFWGRGVATAALAAYLSQNTQRPLYARVAVDNMGSVRVLQKCGFVKMGQASNFSYSRQREVDEYIMRLA